LAFLVLATAPEWSVRPQVISLALLVLTAHFIARDRITWLPLACLIWGNAHAMVIFGVVMAGACALEALIWTRRRLARDLTTTLACVLVPLVSPIGAAYWPRVFSTVAMSRTLDLQEYRTPLEAGDLPFWFALAALVGIVGVRWTKLRERPRVDRILLIAAIILALAAVTAARNIAFFAVIAAPVLSRLWPSAKERSPTSRPLGVGGYVLIGAAILAAAAAVRFHWRDHGTRLGWRPMTPQVVDAVRACPDPLFNHLEDGGYLMWAIPEKRVFVDSRMEAYPVELLRRSRVADLDGEYRQLFRDYRVRCALVDTDSRLREQLAQDGSMMVAYADAARTVFAARNGTVKTLATH
jgi:hypothetical protein